MENRESGGRSDPRDRELEEIRRENEVLRRENEELRRENGKLRSQVWELQRQLAEALKKLDEVIRAQKRQAAPFSKGAPKDDPKPRGRKAGEDYGTPAHREPPPHVDEIVPVTLPARCDCGGPVAYEETVAQFQTEIPKRPIHRRFDIEVGRCGNCGKRVQGRHALQTSDALGAAASQLGPDAQAMTALLKDQVGVSYGDVQTIFREFFGIGLSRGGAAQIVLRVAERVKAAYHGIEVAVRRSRTVYPDETGWKVGGLLQWMWVFVTRTATLFRIRPSRGYDVPKEVLGANWNGTMIHDGWRPYDRFEQALHQQCLAHFQRRAKTILEFATRGAVRFPRSVLELLRTAFDLRDRRDAGKISRHGLAVSIGHCERRLQKLLDWRLSHPANVKFSNHLSRHHNELFLFLKDPSIEATSWPADQAIRPAVANRKVFGGNRDPSGARAQEILASIAATCVQRGVAVFDYLSRVIRTAPVQRDSSSCLWLGLPHPA